ncbi:SRPBCC family protein [Caldimonas sp. KR1-144]|uniref:SRPBCC family protein n=1 Tax=Caldimonas sp. KR1-144 TaxID=3400911 RepID=UPI003C12635C
MPRHAPRSTVLAVLFALGVALCGNASATERSLDKQVVVAASLDDAWAAWTTREGITSFFAPEAEIDARVDGAFHVYIDPYAQPGMKGADTMRFMALQPKRMLSFDWNAPPSLPTVREQRTFVVVRFEPVGERQTRVTLHHTGWGDGGEWDQAHAYFDRAWGNVLANLQRRFETGPVDWTAWRERLRKLHAEAAASAPSR